MPDWMLQLNIVSGALPVTVWFFTIVAVVALLIRKPTRSWAVRASVAIITGAVLGAAFVLFLNYSLLAGIVLPPSIIAWMSAAFAGLGVVAVNLWRTKPGRKIAAVGVAVLVIVSLWLGMNAVFNIDRRLGDVFGIPTASPAQSLPALSAAATPEGPLYERWTPPADMPTHGEVRLLTGAFRIPSSAGFEPRDAAVYLPPAALVPDAPRLPFTVMMMGLPGNPSADIIASVLDELAAEHDGLAPLVIVADQLGSPRQDPACMDSDKYGGVATYFNEDIPAYARAELNILDATASWTIAGYSNGGACAVQWAAEHPDVWGNLVVVSGDEYPGAENERTVARELYGGDESAYEASRPASILAANAGRYAGHVAVFTGGDRDTEYAAHSERNAELFASAGFDSRFISIPGGYHVGAAVPDGLRHAFEVLYPHLGLAPAD